MFSTHVTNDLSAYSQGELPHERSRLIAEHLILCSSCRSNLNEIKQGIRFAELLPQVTTPAEIWAGIERGLDHPSHPSTELSQAQAWLFSFKVWRPAMVGVASGLLVVLGLVALWLYQRESRPSWVVARINGSPRIGSSKIGDRS